MSREDEGRDWRDASVSQGTPKNASNHGKLGGARRFLLQGLQREHDPADTFISDVQPPEP